MLMKINPQTTAATLQANGLLFNRVKTLLLQGQMMEQQQKVLQDLAVILSRLRQMVLPLLKPTVLH
jgi:hypothetical protein